MKQLIKTVLASSACIGGLLLINACHKNAAHQVTVATTTAPTTASANRGQSLDQVVTVAAIRPGDGGTATVLFNQNQEVFTISDATAITQLNAALQANMPVKITYNPWSATVLQVATLSNSELLSYGQRKAAPAADAGTTVSSMRFVDNSPIPETVNDVSALGVLNTTTPGLTPAIPDMATAQLMFNYITKQCCALPSPYALDFCISFQYCEDGCYARAHKMCWILNNKYHYATHKVFSFANVGSHSLSVKAEKWGGCCINWWYHVAPLVTINTPKGPKAYVFDPAMFDQPVPLNTWLNAQKNPACSSDAYVDMFNIQPTSSYSPSSYSGYTISPDPYYTDTDTTLVHYSTLQTCP